jgi:hypothetical protein
MISKPYSDQLGWAVATVTTPAVATITTPAVATVAPAVAIEAEVKEAVVVVVMAVAAVVAVAIAIATEPTTPEVTDQLIWLKQASIMVMITTVGRMAMMSQRIMIANPARKNGDIPATKRKQMVIIRWRAPPRTDSSPSGEIDGVGSVKQIILRRKKTNQ